MADIRATFSLKKRHEIHANFIANPQRKIEAVFQISKNIRFHNELLGRDEEDCHPIQAITGLDYKINEISVLAKGYVHEQGIASATWTINHNLNKFPSVSVVDSAGNEIISEVKYIDLNTCIISMNGTFKGKAFLN